MQRTSVSTERLEELALGYRNNIIDMIYHGKAGHPGGSLSAVDVMAYLYATDIDPTQSERSRLVMSKGHSAPAMYAILCGLGLITKDELKTFRCIDSRLQGHTAVCTIPETDMSSGLLGQGLSEGVGMALGKKLKKSDKRVYVICGDGELHEGQMWEGMMEGSHYRLDNLYLVVDNNNLSSKTTIDKVMNIEPLADKIRAFGWHVEEADGHDFDAIAAAFAKLDGVTGQPKCLIAHTVKGKGVSFMENNPKWHSSPLTDDEYTQAKKDLGGKGS